MYCVLVGGDIPRSERNSVAPTKVSIQRAGCVVFLTSEQLEALTGYRKPALQRQWLAENGYHFDVSGNGRPVVLVAQVFARQRVPASKRATHPNWAEPEDLG